MSSQTFLSIQVHAGLRRLMSSSTQDPTAAVERARKLQSSLENANLNLVKSRQLFDTRVSAEDSGLNLSLAPGESAGLVDPAVASTDLAAQLVSPNQRAITMGNPDKVWSSHSHSSEN